MHCKRLVFFSAMWALSSLGVACSPDAGLGGVETLQQAGTLTGSIGRTVWSDGEGHMLAGTSPGCETGNKLLESTSGVCTPDGKYTEGCDICCDASLDSLCANAGTADEYFGRQLDTALAAAGTPANAAAVSGVVSVVADYIQRMSTSQGDRDRACNAHLKMQAIYERTATALGTPKNFRIKSNTSNTFADLSLRNALISQRQALRLTYLVCLDPALGSK